MQINILAVGDVCGDPGLEFLEKNLKQLQKEREIAFTVVNGENANVVGIISCRAQPHSAAGQLRPSVSRARHCRLQP